MRFVLLGDARSPSSCRLEGATVSSWLFMIFSQAGIKLCALPRAAERMNVTTGRIGKLPAFPPKALQSLSLLLGQNLSVQHLGQPEYFT